MIYRRVYHKCIIYLVHTFNAAQLRSHRDSLSPVLGLFLKSTSYTARSWKVTAVQQVFDVEIAAVAMRGR